MITKHYYTREQFRAWGSQGGKKSTRKLTTEESKRMLAIREQKRARKKVENNACVNHNPVR